MVSKYNHCELLKSNKIIWQDNQTMIIKLTCFAHEQIQVNALVREGLLKNSFNIRREVHIFFK